jgi:hypothetical protein
MTRDMSARTRIHQYLRTHGAVEDPTGYATTALKDAIDYQGTAVAFIQLVAAMDRDGEITREVRGKRTYRIALGQALAHGQFDDGAPGAAQPGQPDAQAGEQKIEIDYDRLARAVVREFFAQAGQAGRAAALAGQATASAAQATGPAGQAAAADSRATVERLRAERDEYALRLEMARLRLDALLGNRTEELGSLMRRLPLND